MKPLISLVCRFIRHFYSSEKKVCTVSRQRPPYLNFPTRRRLKQTFSLNRELLDKVFLPEPSF